MVRTPGQVHPRSTVPCQPNHPFKHTRAALYPCQPNCKSTCSSARAQHGIPASQAVRTPVQVHQGRIPASPCSSAGAQHGPCQPNWYEHPFKYARTALYSCQQVHLIPARQIVRTPVQVYPCQPNGKNTRSSAPKHHCTLPAKRKNTRSSAPAQRCVSRLWQ